VTKKNLLEIVQDVLNDIDGDFANSINDSEQANQIAYLVKSTYEAMMTNKNWPHTRRSVNLTPSGNNLLPTHMTIDETIKELISIHYDRHKLGDSNLKYELVSWKDPDDFLRYTYGRNSADTNVQTVTDPSGVKLLIINNQGPQFFTSFDDNTLIFDSYDNEVDTTLQSNKSTAIAYIIPSFSLADDFVPDLPEEAFPLLIEDCKSRASLKFRQVADQKSEQEQQRQRSWLSRKDWRAHGGIKYPDYGRHARRYVSRDPTFRYDRE
jgi:hypothetical protein